MAQRIDLYQFQMKELEDANLKLGEEDELLDERRRLMNFNKIFERSSAAYEAIQGDSKGLDWIGNAMGALEDAATIDEQFKEASESVTTSFYALQDAAYQIKNVLDELEFDPARLNEVEQRLALLQNLKRKYGSTVEEILAYYDKIKTELNELLNRDEILQVKERKVLEMEAVLNELAAELSTVRKDAAHNLSEAIMAELRELHMEKAKFIVNFDELPYFDANGKDQVIFIFLRM